MLQPLPQNGDPCKRARTVANYEQLQRQPTYTEQASPNQNRHLEDPTASFRLFRQLCYKNLHPSLVGQKSVFNGHRQEHNPGILEMRLPSPRRQDPSNTHGNIQNTQGHPIQPAGNVRKRKQKRRREETETPDCSRGPALVRSAGSWPPDRSHGTMNPIPSITSCQAGSQSPSPQPGQELSLSRNNSGYGAAGSGGTYHIGQTLEWSGQACKIHSINPDGSYNLLFLQNGNVPLMNIRLPTNCSLHLPTNGNFGFRGQSGF